MTLAPGIERFYRFQAPIYDLTRPFILFGRREAVRRLGILRGDRVLDVGCGTGWNFPSLATLGAEIVGVEPSSSMRARASARAERLGAQVTFDARPYGSHDEYRASAAHILFSYSLSMIPDFAEVLQRAREDLAPHGRIAVVDFLDATNAPIGSWLRACHVFLGNERLHLLSRLFPHHRIEVRGGLLWRYFHFLGEA